MEESKTKLWDSINTDVEDKPKIVFEFNKPVVVKFKDDFKQPDEFPSNFGDENATYCVFPVLHNGEESAIITSAYSLLRGLKKRMPLANKELIITKKMVDGKQQYVVENYA